MINTKDVVKLKIPFPDISSELAQLAHMYICYQKNQSSKLMVKCQSFKRSLFVNDACVIKNGINEMPDPSRNPFVKPTIIDCDKLFEFHNVIMPLNLRTSIRTDICQELYDNVDGVIRDNGCVKYTIDKSLLLCVDKKVG